MMTNCEDILAQSFRQFLSRNSTQNDFRIIAIRNDKVQRYWKIVTTTNRLNMPLAHWTRNGWRQSAVEVDHPPRRKRKEKVVYGVTIAKEAQRHSSVKTLCIAYRDTSIQNRVRALECCLPSPKIDWGLTALPAQIGYIVPLISMLQI